MCYPFWCKKKYFWDIELQTLITGFNYGPSDLNSKPRYTANKYSSARSRIMVPDEMPSINCWRSYSTRGVIPETFDTFISDNGYYPCTQLYCANMQIFGNSHTRASLQIYWTVFRQNTLAEISFFNTLSKVHNNVGFAITILVHVICSQT